MSQSPFKPSSMDWPLSRDEKKARVLRCYDNEVRATQQLLNSSGGSHAGALAGSARTESFLPPPLPGSARNSGSYRCSFGGSPGPELELPCPNTPDGLQQKIRVSDAASEPEKPIHALPQGVDPDIWRRAIEAALSTIVAHGGPGAEAPHTPVGRAQQQAGDDKRRTRSAPGHRLEEEDEPVQHVLRPRRYSRGSREGRDIPKVTFEDGKQAGEDDDSSDEQLGKVGVIASRRRLSRGPDGAPVRISAKPEESDDDDEPNDIGSEASDLPGDGSQEPGPGQGGYVKTVTAAGAAVGGAGGFLSGGALGAAVGLGGALFTFGLSIPIGAAVGSGAGLIAGTAVGGATGYISTNSNAANKRSDRSLSRGRK
mmetsp:Transcript_91577/g.162984  ORF Transcript_91577/g.162984 Transcript_91577/m.162984 type:complete len:369 (+) Transcript_91577:62-1168(+)